jgi:hypothetical protein
MYELANVALINWFLAERQDIRVEGTIGMYGENRAGKSTILDAVQTVMLSNDKTALQLNKAANQEKKRRNKRSVHSYCLGRTGGAGEAPLRDSCYTHLALAFHDRTGGRRLSTGLMLEARASESREETLGRWIAVGVEITTDDLVIASDGGDVARTWRELQDQIEQRCAAEGGTFRLYLNPRDHVADLLHLTSQRGRHGGVDQYRKAFANAVSFETIEDETQFVRGYVLEKDDISIAALRESIRTYREVAQTIEGLEAQRDALAGILDAARRYGGLVAERAVTAWVAARAQALNACREYRRLARELAKAEAEQRNKDRLLEGYARDMREYTARREAIRGLIRESDRSKALLRIELDLQKARALMADALGPRRDWQAAVLCATSVLDLHRDAGHGPGRRPAPPLERLRAEHAALVDRLETIRDLGGGSAEWPRDVEAMQAALDGLPPLGPALRMLERLSDEAVRREGELLREREELTGQLRAIEAHGAAISEATRRLLDELERRGMRPRLLCSSVRVRDEEWRDAAEVILARDREAIVLPPEQAREAITVLRELRRGRRGQFWGCRIANTARIEHRPVPKGSLAEVLETTDPLVRAFVVARIGNVRRVRTEAELLAGGRAVMPDGTCCDGLVSELRRVDTYKIGKEAAGRATGPIEARLGEIGEELAEASAAKAQYRAAVERLAPLARALDGTVRLVDAVDGHRAAEERVRRLERQLGSVTDSIDPRFQEELDWIERTLAQLDEEIAATGKERDGALAQVARLRARIEGGHDTTGSRMRRDHMLRQFAKVSATVPRGEALTVWRDCLRAADGALPLVALRAGERMDALRDGIPAARSEVFERCFEFRRFSGRTLGFDREADVEGVVVPWAQALRRDIEESRLIGYKQVAVEAAEESRSLLKGNFINTLRDRFGRVRGAIETLNATLAPYDFHKEKYRFEVQHDPEYAPLIRLVDAAAQDDTILLPLFGGTQAGTSPYRESLELIDRILMEEDAEFARFEDYRNYFRFTLMMKDVQTGKETTFAHRLGVGSGAEKQVPFYVSIGAALAAAYHGSKYDAGAEGGLGLCLFDEAFMKMDHRNQREVLRFYRRIGLQPVVAGPKASKGFMQRNMDSIVKVSRPSHYDMRIGVTRPGPALRAALDAADPEEWPRETIERLMRQMRDGPASEAAE